jgi:lactoylglutathione lyase
LITDSIEMAHQQAIAAGAVEIAAPKTKPWGQVVSYVRCPDGTLVELCTPMS